MLIAFLTTGRIIFSAFFAITFIILIFFSFKKDAKYLNQYYEKAPTGILIGIILFFALLFGYVIW